MDVASFPKDSPFVTDTEERRGRGYGPSYVHAPYHFEPETGSERARSEVARAESQNASRQLELQGAIKSAQSGTTVALKDGGEKSLLQVAGVDKAVALSSKEIVGSEKSLQIELARQTAEIREKIRDQDVRMEQLDKTQSLAFAALSACVASEGRATRDMIQANLVQSLRDQLAEALRGRP